MNTTVVIVTFKSKPIIASCLNSIDSTYPIIIVENSEDINFKELIIVTNEIGMGGVTMNREGRKANALLGFLNQFVGDLCDEAWFVLCGIPRRWKP